jgi:uncharacterized membrane protein
MKKLLQNNVLCVIVGSISVLAAIIFAPIWNWWTNCPWGTWGTQIIDILVATLIVLYLALFLFKKIKRATKQAIKVLTIVEFALLALIALGCIFRQFNIIQVNEASQIFALALWTRGSVELFRAYYYRSDTKEVYPVWYLGVSIAMVTLGTYFFARPLIKDIAVLWIFVAILATFGLLLLVIGINNIQKKKAAKPKVEETTKKTKKKTEE